MAVAMWQAAGFERRTLRHTAHRKTFYRVSGRLMNDCALRNTDIAHGGIVSKRLNILSKFFYKRYPPMSAHLLASVQM